VVFSLENIEEQSDPAQSATPGLVVNFLINNLGPHGHNWYCF
jgi:hypothetical protein